MKNFKDFFTEDASQSMYKPAQLMAIGALPLTSTVMDRLGYKYESNMFHATDVRGLKNLIKLQGKKKQISAFTKGGTNLLTKIVIKPEFIVVLEGDIVLEGESDLWTHLEQGGRRWLSFRPGDSKEGDKLKAMLISSLKDKIFKLGYESIEDENSDTHTIETISYMMKKDRGVLIKWYHQMAERLIEKNYKLLNAHLKNNTEGLNYNEVVTNNIKIKGVYTLGLASKKPIEDLGLKYLGVVEQSDLSALDPNKVK